MDMKTTENGWQSLQNARNMMGVSNSAQLFSSAKDRQAERRSSDVELRRMSSQLLTIQENERKRISMDLHDGIGQTLTLIKLELEEATKQFAKVSSKDSFELLQRLKLRVQNAMDEVRRVTMDLHPSTIDDLGLLATLSWFFRELEAACQDIKITKDFSIHEGCLPGLLKIQIFRILQEAVVNIIKHAKADLIQVSLKKSGNVIHLLIEDNGQGFDQAGLLNYCPLDKGIGLLSMKERAKFSKGIFEIESATGQGTRIFVSWLCT